MTAEFSRTGRPQRFGHTTVTYTPQDARIVDMKRWLRNAMGQDEFIAFYKTTSMNSTLLEDQLSDKICSLLRSRSDASKADGATYPK